jgi:hypothetical protein
MVGRISRWCRGTLRHTTHISTWTGRLSGCGVRTDLTLRWKICWHTSTRTVGPRCRWKWWAAWQCTAIREVCRFIPNGYRLWVYTL